MAGSDTVPAPSPKPRTLNPEAADPETAHYRATRSGRAYRRSTMAEANSEHLTSVAPSIRRAKS